MAPVLVIDRENDEPVYGQIARQFRDLIATGRLPTGSRVPAVRALASDLGVNLNTVARAYRVLEAEGFLAIRGRSGATVLSPASADRGDARASLRAELREWLARALQAGVPASTLETLFRRELAALTRSGRA